MEIYSKLAKYCPKLTKLLKLYSRYSTGNFLFAFSFRFLFPILLLSTLFLSSCSKELESNGYIEAEYVQASSDYSGRLVKLHVKRGDWVNLNDPLFDLDSDIERFNVDIAKQNLQAAESNYANLTKGKRPDEIDALKAEREQANAALELSKIQFTRNKKLLSQKAISQEQYDESQTTLDANQARLLETEAQLRLALLGAREDEIAKAWAEVKAATANLQQAEWVLNQKFVFSPINAFVQDTLYNKGEWIGPGLPVISLLPPENLKVRFFVSEKNLAQIKIGQTIIINCDSCKKSFKASINFISPQAEFTPPVIFSQESKGKLVYLIEGKISEEDAFKLHPGQPVNVQVQY